MAKMAKDKSAHYAFPSQFGSHTSMIDEKETTKLKDGKVILRDEYGLYTTERSQLDNGCADPNRYNKDVRGDFLNNGVKNVDKE